MIVAEVTCASHICFWTRVMLTLPEPRPPSLAMPPSLLLTCLHFGPAAAFRGVWPLSCTVLPSFMQVTSDACELSRVPAPQWATHSQIHGTNASNWLMACSCRWMLAFLNMVVGLDLKTFCTVLCMWLWISAISTIDGVWLSLSLRVAEMLRDPLLFLPACCARQNDCCMK